MIWLGVFLMYVCIDRYKICMYLQIWGEKKGENHLAKSFTWIFWHQWSPVTTVSQSRTFLSCAVGDLIFRGRPQRLL